MFGCTTALRISDLLSLQRSALRISNGIYYLSVRSRKTGAATLIRLPEYAAGIIEKYRHRSPCLLPRFNKTNINRYIKLLLQKAGFVSEISLTRDRRGVPLPRAIKKKPCRFCDVASSHTMRRTAITMMLCLGMPEQLVRCISGHAPGSREFYRYVQWAQMYQDQESTLVFQKRKEKHRLSASPETSFAAPPETRTCAEATMAQQWRSNGGTMAEC